MSRLPPRNFQFNLLVSIYFSSNTKAARAGGTATADVSPVARLSELVALPIIFVGASTKLPGRGRVSGVGAVRACAFGLTTLQQRMGDWPNGCIPRASPFSRVPPSALMWSTLISLRMSTTLLATLPAPITAIAELVVVPVFCRLTSARAQS